MTHQPRHLRRQAPEAALAKKSDFVWVFPMHVKPADRADSSGAGLGLPYLTHSDRTATTTPQIKCERVWPCERYVLHGVTTGCGSWSAAAAAVASEHLIDRSSLQWRMQAAARRWPPLAFFPPTLSE